MELKMLSATAFSLHIQRRPIKTAVWRTIHAEVECSSSRRAGSTGVNVKKTRGGNLASRICIASGHRVEIFYTKGEAVCNLKTEDLFKVASIGRPLLTYPRQRPFRLKRLVELGLLCLLLPRLHRYMRSSRTLGAEY